MLELSAIPISDGKYKIIGKYEPLTREQAYLAICRCKAEPELRKALVLAYEAMNYLGDTLNKHDMVEPEDEAVTDEAFEVVSKIIKEQALEAKEHSAGGG